MKITVDLSDLIVDRLTRWRVPPEHCGASLVEKIEFVLDDFCVALEIHEGIQARNALYRLFDMRHPHDLDDEEISL